MPKTTYIFRLDDITPTMNWGRFEELVQLFQRYQVSAILGVVPDSKDQTLVVDPARSDFWEVLKQLQKSGWVVAQHGFRHTYHTKNGGLLGIQPKSEFAGRSYTAQRNDIAAGKALLESHLNKPITWWMAPSHSFDVTTCRVLRDLGFTYVTDGVALWPFRRFGLTWVPTQLWRPRVMPFGAWTICLHPNTMNEADIRELEMFLRRQASHCAVTPPLSRPLLYSYPFIVAWRTVLRLQQWRQYKQAKVAEGWHYSDPSAYDQRDREPLERYVHALWQPVLSYFLSSVITAETTVCDLGCGTFTHTAQMGHARHVYAVDTNTRMLAYGRAKVADFKHKLSVKQESALASSIPSGACDVVWSVGLSEFVDAGALFDEIDRMAAPQATAVLQFPNLLHPYNIMVVIVAHLLGLRLKRYRTLFAWRRLAHERGWQITQIVSRGIYFVTPRPLARPLLLLWLVLDWLYRPLQSWFPLGNNVLLVLRRTSISEHPPAQH